MPEGSRHTNAAYLGELPWATAANEYPDSWCQIWPLDNLEPMELEVYPSWAEYLWEGSGLDLRIVSRLGSQPPSYSRRENSVGCQALGNGVGRMAR